MITNELCITVLALFKAANLHEQPLSIDAKYGMGKSRSVVRIVQGILFVEIQGQNGNLQCTTKYLLSVYRYFTKDHKQKINVMTTIKISVEQI